MSGLSLVIELVLLNEPYLTAMEFAGSVCPLAFLFDGHYHLFLYSPRYSIMRLSCNVTRFARSIKMEQEGIHILR